MSENLKELQEALDNRPRGIPTLGVPPLEMQEMIVRTQKWCEDFARKFAVYRASLEKPKTNTVGKFPRLNAYAHDKDLSREALEEYTEKLIDWAADAEDLLMNLLPEKVLPVSVWLKKYAKTQTEIRDTCGLCDVEWPCGNFCGQKWVSVSKVSALFRAKQQSLRELLEEQSCPIYWHKYGLTTPIGQILADFNEWFNRLKEKVFDETHGSTEK